MTRSTGFLVWTDSIASSKLGENVEVVEYILDQAEMLGLQYGLSRRFSAGYYWRHRGLCSRDVEF